MDVVQAAGLTRYSTVEISAVFLDRVCHSYLANPPRIDPITLFLNMSSKAAPGAVSRKSTAS